jgi:predicted nucleotidyltransferase
MIWKWGKDTGTTYEAIFRKLHEKNIQYLIIGGVAVNLYGVPRATGDIDMMLAMDKENLLRFVAVAKELSLVPKAPVKPEDLADPAKLKQWRETKNMKVFSFISPDNPFITVDIMTENYLSFAEAYAKKSQLSAWGVEVSVVGLEDLMELKRLSGRDQDIADIESLKKRGEMT